MKLLLLALTFLSLHARATGSIQDHTEVHSLPLNDPGLIQIQTLAEELLSTHRLTMNQYSCGEVLTFRGPINPLSGRNLRLWALGIENELITLNQDEDIKLSPVKRTFQVIKHSVTLLADRNSQQFSTKSVNALSTAIFNETEKNPRDYFLLFGDYLDGKTGWMTALVLVKMSNGNALMFANSNDCR